MEKIGEYYIIVANELLEIATELFDDFYMPPKGDHAAWETLAMKVRKVSGKNYRFNTSDWGLDDVEYPPPKG